MSGDGGGASWFSLANLITLAAAIPSAAAGYWTWRQGTWSHQDKQRSDDANAQRQAQQDLRADQASILEWHKGEIAGLRKELSEVETRANTWESRCRWWYGRAHDMLGQLREARHVAINLQQVCASLQARGVIGDLIVDGLPETPPALPARIEDTKDEA